MPRSVLFGFIIVGLVAILLGGYYWYTQQASSVQSAETYQDSGFSDLPLPAAVVSEESAQVSNTTPTPAVVSNPPLTNGTTLSELESDLDETIIEEESFTDL